jgi:hypothetical protein
MKKDKKMTNQGIVRVKSVSYSLLTLLFFVLSLFSDNFIVRAHTCTIRKPRPLIRMGFCVVS